MDVQWYPGHMTKARRMMEENIRLVDLLIELVDARIPLSSRNPDIDSLCTGKGRVVLLCKADLADPAKTEEFTEYFRRKGILAAAVDARERKAGEVVRRYMQEAGREKTARDRARGIAGRPLRAMVAGIPNVGKSTFINSFVGRASAKTGNRPGVTRGRQWIRLGGDVELLDTPGILWPKFDNPLIGTRLALVGAIRDEVLDRQGLAVWLIDYLEKEYPGMLRQRYLTGQEARQAVPDPADVPADGAQQDTADPAGRTEETMLPSGYALLHRIARARRLLMKGGEPDVDRAAAMLIDDCRNGRIGRISLDRPQDAAQMEKERRTFTASREQEKAVDTSKKAGRGGKRARGAAGRGEGYTRTAGGRSNERSGRAKEAARGRQGESSVRKTRGPKGKTAGRNSGGSRRRGS